MRLSIVIVSWNAREHLLRCLATLRPFIGRPDTEVFVVDNASSDGSPDAVAADFPDVRLLRGPVNEGFARANNRALRLATGTHAALINSDVELVADCLSVMLRFMDSHPEVGLAGPRVLNSDGTLQPSCRRSPTLMRALARAFCLDSRWPWLTFHGHDRTGPVDIVSGCFMVARREAMEVVGLLDEDYFFYAEDFDWCHRYRRHGWLVYYVRDAEAVHHGGASSAQAPLAYLIEQCRANLLYWRKNHGFIAAFAYRIVLVLHYTIRLLGSLLGLLVRPGSDGMRNRLRRSALCLRWLLLGGSGSK